MKIKETQASLIRRFGEIIGKHFPGVIQYQYYDLLTYGYGRNVVQSERLFNEDAKIVCSINMGVLHKKPFEGGQWENIQIDVMNDLYFEGVKGAARDYEQETGKKVALFLEF